MTGLDGSPDEMWCDIPGYEGLYQVSDMGKVRSLDRLVGHVSGRQLKRGKVLVSSASGKYGHQFVVLSRKSKTKPYSVHKLVMLAFVGPKPEGMEILHWDGDPTNNTLGNLRYGTSLENKADMRRHGTHHYARRTHCNKGHEFSSENTLIRPDGGRRCRACDRNRTISRRGTWGKK